MTHMEMVMKEIIIRSLQPLFEKARKDNLVFRNAACKSLVFTPDELETAHFIGRFVWGPVNWELVDPEEIKETLKAKLDEAKAKLDEAKAKLDEAKAKLDEAEKEYLSFLDRLRYTGHEPETGEAKCGQKT